MHPFGHLGAGLCHRSFVCVYVCVYGGGEVVLFSQPLLKLLSKVLPDCGGRIMAPSPSTPAPTMSPVKSVVVHECFRDMWQPGNAFWGSEASRRHVPLFEKPLKVHLLKIMCRDS